MALLTFPPAGRCFLLLMASACCHHEVIQTVTSTGEQVFAAEVMRCQKAEERPQLRAPRSKVHLGMRHKLLQKAWYWPHYSHWLGL